MSLFKNALKAVVSDAYGFSKVVLVLAFIGYIVGKAEEEKETN